MSAVPVFHTVADLEAYLRDHGIVMTASFGGSAWSVRLIGGGIVVEGRGDSLIPAFIDAQARLDLYWPVLRKE